MKLSELESTLLKAQADENVQNEYVLGLGRRIEAGETTIKVFSDNVWTVVKLVDFWQLQYDKYMAMAKYSGELVAIQQRLQKELDDALLTVNVPIDSMVSLPPVKAS